MATTDERGSGNEAGTAELLWRGRDLPTRGPKRALDLDAIAETAVRIADIDGLAAVSMQRVAGELDFTKMALYRYVTGKAELTALMIEAAVGPPPDLGAVAGGWRARITEVAEQLAVTWQRHPWLPWATIGDRVMGPREVGWTERAVAAFDGTPLDGAEKLDAAFIVFGHIRNTQSMTTAGTQPWNTDRQFDPTLRELVPDYAERFPALTAATAAATAAASSGDGAGLGDRFANRGSRLFGLRCILDGLEVLIAGRDRDRATRDA
jgi:AcrR family transcriptional regulator